MDDQDLRDRLARLEDKVDRLSEQLEDVGRLAGTASTSAQEKGVGCVGFLMLCYIIWVLWQIRDALT